MRVGWIGLLGLFSMSTGLAAPPEPDVVVRPEAAPGPLDNPLKGWCPYADAGPIRQPYSMVFLDAPWKDLEPEEGHYALDRWEATAWSVPEAKGKHVVFRVYIGYPCKPSGLPGWLEVRHPAAFATGGTLSVSVRGENQGVAPFYYPWPVELALIDEAGEGAGRWPLRCDVRAWLPGPFRVDGGVEVHAPAGRYRLALGVIDPWTGRPAVAFASKLPGHEGWTVLSTMAVGQVR